MQQAVAAWGSVRSGWLGGALRAWAEGERGRFVPWLPVFMGGGVVLYFALAEEPSRWAGLAAALFFVAACIPAWRYPLPRAAALAGLAAALGFLSAQGATWRALPIEALPSRAVVMTGLVRGVDTLPDGRRLVLDGVRTTEASGAAGGPLARKVRVRMKRGDLTEVSAGDRVQVRAVMRPPAMPAYPGAWDLQRDAFFAGIAAGGTALNPLVVLERLPPSGPAAGLQALRDGIGRRVMAGIAGAPGAIAATFLTGTTVAIPQRDREAFRDSGLAHLLAVAGLHIGIVMGLVLGLTRLLLACWERAALHWPTKAIAAVTALVAGGCYMLLAGAHVPVMRSFAMASLVTLGLVIGRRALSLRGLALAAVVLMLIAPYEVVGVSFGMSFSAVLALISGYEALRPALARLHGEGWWRRSLSHVIALVLTSLLAGTASAPFGAYHFGHFQLYFIVANVVAVPLTAMWVMPAGLLALALMPFGLEQLALTPMGWGVEAILWIGRTVSAWPAATLAVPHMPAWGLAVFSLGLAWLGLWRTRARLLGVPVMLAGLLSPVAAPAPDLLVSNEARLIAIRSGGYWVQSRPGASKFTLEAWQNHLASGPLRPIRDGEPAECSAGQCRLGSVLMLRGSARPADCEGVTLLVSAEPARGECPASVALLDRFTVWRDGAHAVWLGERPRVLSDRAYRGLRPWVPPMPTARRVVPNLPMAPTEELPAAGELPAAAEE